MVPLLALTLPDCPGVHGGDAWSRLLASRNCQEKLGKKQEELLSSRATSSQDFIPRVVV